MENKNIDSALHSMDGIYIIDIYCNVIYRELYRMDDIPTERLPSLVKSNDKFLVLNEQQNIFKQHYNEFCIMYIIPTTSNELFISEAIAAFKRALHKILKYEIISRENILENFDKLIILLNMFVYRGVICEIDDNKLSDMVPCRPFENMKNIKMPKSFTSYIFSSSIFNKRNA